MSKGAPLSFSEWCYEAQIEAEHEKLNYELGDGACLLSDYKTIMYALYVKEFNKNSNKMNLQFIIDAGHAWLRVPMKTLEDWNIDILISKYSFRSQSYAYLEEDCDAGVFLGKAKEKEIRIEINDLFVEDFQTYLGSANEKVYRFNNETRNHID
jgi:hypothetical protein